MGLSSEKERHERAWREVQRLKHSTPSFLSSYHEEHGWRAAGEQAIRAEMERRMDVYLLQKRRKTG